jgi:hypothetical protein
MFVAVMFNECQIVLKLIKVNGQIFWKQLDGLTGDIKERIAKFGDRFVNRSSQMVERLPEIALGRLLRKVGPK